MSTTHYSNPQLSTKYQQNSTFKSLMDQNHQKYQQRLQQSIYSDLSKIHPKLLQLSSQLINQTNHNGSKIYSEKKHILYVFSHFQPQSPQQLTKLFLHFISTFPQPKQPFHLIYVNTIQTGKSKCWSSFKSYVLEELPLKYLLYLQKLILIRPSFFDKASSMVRFGVQNKFISGKLQTVDSLKIYFESIGKKIQEMKKILPEQVIQEQDPKVQNVVKATVPFFICNFDQNRTSYLGNEQDLPNEMKKIQTNLGSTSASIGITQKKKRKGLENYPSGQLGIPLTLELMMFYFIQSPTRCQSQGIFRKCTSIDDQLLLMSELQKQNYEILAAVDNSIAVASTMKRFLGNLQPPIIPYDIYDKITNDYSLTSIKAHLQHFPIINFMTLMHVLKFLKQHIIPNQKRNLMTLENLAICFAPCLMKSKQVTAKQILLASINVEITKTLLIHFEEIFGDNQKQHRISSKAYKLYRKNSKLNSEESPSKKFKKQMEQNEEKEEFNGSEAGVKCHEDFLQAANTILEDEEFEMEKLQPGKYSRKGSENNRMSRAYEQKKFSQANSPKSEHGSENLLTVIKQTQSKQHGMKKVTSHKRLPFPKQDQNIRRKSDTEDKQSIAKEYDFVNSNSGEEGLQRLNKLRVNRSRMANS